MAYNTDEVESENSTDSSKVTLITHFEKKTEPVTKMIYKDVYDDEGNLLAKLTLDNGSFEDILGDFTRANKGQQGFTLSSKVILDRPDTNEILADIFRKNDPKYESTARILAYNGRYYLIYTNDCLHYFITKTGDE